MVVLNLKLDGVYGFSHFEINFTYPKKVVNSIIDDEHLEGRDRFRYKKAVILSLVIRMTAVLFKKSLKFYPKQRKRQAQNKLQTINLL